MYVYSALIWLEFVGGSFFSLGNSVSLFIRVCERERDRERETRTERSLEFEREKISLQLT